MYAPMVFAVVLTTETVMIAEVMTVAITIVGTTIGEAMIAAITIVGVITVGVMVAEDTAGAGMTEGETIAEITVAETTAVDVMTRAAMTVDVGATAATILWSVRLQNNSPNFCTKGLLDGLRTLSG